MSPCRQVRCILEQKLLPAFSLASPLHISKTSRELLIQDPDAGSSRMLQWWRLSSSVEDWRKSKSPGCRICNRYTGQPGTGRGSFEGKGRVGHLGSIQERAAAACCHHLQPLILTNQPAPDDDDQPGFDQPDFPVIISCIISNHSNSLPSDTLGSNYGWRTGRWRLAPWRVPKFN